MLTTAQRKLIAVLEELPRVYSGLAGDIVRVQAVETNGYEVRVLQEERTDIVSFRATTTPQCTVQVEVISERSARQDGS